MVMSTTIISHGFALNLCILVLLCDIILHIPLAYDIPSVPKPDTSDPVVHLAFILGSSGVLLELEPSTS